MDCLFVILSEVAHRFNPPASDRIMALFAAPRTGASWGAALTSGRIYGTPTRCGVRRSSTPLRYAASRHAWTGATGAG